LRHCGNTGWLWQPPIGAPGALPQTAAVQSQSVGDDSGSWMAPGAASQDLLYVTDLNTVEVFTYPRGKYQGTLRGFEFAIGICSDANGNVYATDEGYDRVSEYAHGSTKRLRTIPTGQSFGCSVDRTTGNLAIVNKR
jgi:hypothetical protein